MPPTGRVHVHNTYECLAWGESRPIRRCALYLRSVPDATGGSRWLYGKVRCDHEGEEEASLLRLEGVSATVGASYGDAVAVLHPSVLVAMSSVPAERAPGPALKRTMDGGVPCALLGASSFAADADGRSSASS